LKAKPLPPQNLHLDFINSEASVLEHLSQPELGVAVLDAIWSDLIYFTSSVLRNADPEAVLGPPKRFRIGERGESLLAL